jgi:hypothetical protein
MDVYTVPFTPMIRNEYFTPLYVVVASLHRNVKFEDVRNSKEEEHEKKKRIKERRQEFRPASPKIAMAISQ